ncbi:hypothetical protein FRB90_005171 [Tulasnella sp. 427]|nr:hypothetical protein FRB90_005171 [Tulasnella sp. 427]
MPVKCSPDAFTLVPTTSSLHPRYDGPVHRDDLVRHETKIPAATHFLRGVPAAALPEGWTELIHPEGSVYYVNDQHSIISNTNPRLPGALSTFTAAISEIKAKIPPESNSQAIEIYLNISSYLKLPAKVCVEYYLVDYDNKTIFWIEEVDTRTAFAGANVVFGQFESMKHLRLALESEFWTHIEYYPCHQLSYDLRAEQELAEVLRRDSVDDMTAPGAVSPYGADECAQYLKLIEQPHGDTFDSTEADDHVARSSRRSWTARLWASICRIRHINRYGLPNPRLDRLQGLDSYLQQQTRQSLVLAFGEALCFGMSRKVFYKLTELWNGRIVYQRHWQPFLEDQRSEWRWTVLGGLYLLFMNTVQVIYGTSTTLLVFSFSATLASSLMAGLMIQTHSKDRLKTASDISSYVSMTENVHHGLRPLSIAYTLPKASLTWATFASVMNVGHQCYLSLQDDIKQLYLVSAVATLPILLVLFVFCAFGPATA